MSPLTCRCCIRACPHTGSGRACIPVDCRTRCIGVEPPASGWSRPPHCSHVRVEVGGTECGGSQQLLRPGALILNVQFCFTSGQVCPPHSVLTLALPLCCHLCLKAPPLRPSPDISSRRNESPIWKPPSSALSPMVLPDSVGCRQAVTGFSLAGLASALLKQSPEVRTFTLLKGHSHGLQQPVHFVGHVLPSARLSLARSSWPAFPHSPSQCAPSKL